jgi:vacuolar protein-sorting-associated protein 4
VADVLKPYLGQSEQRVAEIWAEARKVVPCVIFLDEVDSLGGARSEGGGSDGGSDTRRSVLNQILTEMDGVGKNNKGLLVLAATNTPRSLDGALLRRFQKRVYIPLPDKAARARLLEISLGPQCVYCQRARLPLSARAPPRLTHTHTHCIPRAG